MTGGHQILPSTEQGRKYHEVTTRRGTRDWTSWADQFDRAYLDCKEVGVKTIDETRPA